MCRTHSLVKLVIWTSSGGRVPMRSLYERLLVWCPPHPAAHVSIAFQSIVSIGGIARRRVLGSHSSLNCVIRASSVGMVPMSEL